MRHRVTRLSLALALGGFLLIPAAPPALAQGGEAENPRYDITLATGFSDTLAEGNIMVLVYSVTQHGVSSPAPEGTEVQLLSQTQGGKGTAAKLLAHTGTTDATGKAFLVFIGASGFAEAPGFLPRKVKLYAKAGNSESAASGEIAVGTIPPTSAGNFLTGTATEKMIVEEAKAFCASHGGALPKLNGKDALGGDDVQGPTVNLDGFGPVEEPATYVTGDAPKPKPQENHAAYWAAITELRSADYWTGTHLAGRPDDFWYFFEDAAVKLAFDDGQADRHVVCVP